MNPEKKRSPGVHLTLATRESTMDFVRGMLRYRGNFDRMAAERAQQRAEQYRPAELVAQLRETAGSDTTAFGSSVRDCLIDVVVHQQDIARPLDLAWTTPPEQVGIALDHALSSRWYGAKKRFAGASLSASDLDWTAGAGSSTITGPVTDLLLVATGRAAGLDHLSGSGMEDLTSQLAG